MRFLLAISIMLGLMAAAGLWQERRTREARHQRDVLLGRTASLPQAHPGVRLILGRPSGQPPFDVPWGPPPPPAAERDRPSGADAYRSDALPPGGPAYAPAPWEPVYEVEVRPGKVLSVLCQEFYGTSRPPVVQRVAEWNGLASPDHLRAGQRLELPGRAWVLGEVP